MGTQLGDVKLMTDPQTSSNLFYIPTQETEMGPIRPNRNQQMPWNTSFVILLLIDTV